MIRNRLLNILFETLYGPLASAYDLFSWIVSGGRWRSWQCVALEYVTGGQVLEVGCGPGHLSRLLADRSDRVVAVDRSAPMCRLAHRRLAPPPTVAVAQADGRVLPFQTASFDTVVSTFPAGYILETATATELARVVRPGGRLVVVLGVASRSFPWRLLAQVADAATDGPALIDRWASTGFSILPQEAEVTGDRVAIIIGRRSIQAAERPVTWHRSCSFPDQTSLYR